MVVKVQKVELGTTPVQIRSPVGVWALSAPVSSRSIEAPMSSDRLHDFNMADSDSEDIPEVKKPRLETSPPLYGSLELIYHDSAKRMHKR